MKLHSFLLLMCSLILVSFSGKNAFRTTTIKAGIFTANRISSVWISAAYGPYLVLGDGKVLGEVSPGKGGIHLASAHDSIRIKIDGVSQGIFKTIKLAGKEAPNSFKIKPLQPALRERIYDDNLVVRTTGGVLRFVNMVNLDRYVAGVVESENGISQNFEYYKAKAIICRTYALNGLSRHSAEGFNLCDQVHCQVYGNKNTGNDDIIMASMATTGVVIVDSELKLITAAFHSNCGGQTVNSEEVWPRETSYLKAVKDTFCLDQPHATWEKTIDQKAWMNYVWQNYRTCDTLNDTLCVFYYHPEKRESDFNTEFFKVPLKTVRSKFNLRSTYFTLAPGDQTKLVLKGRGYGHGIGLCQEGAMKMAQKGYSYPDILHFYYQNIHLVDMSVLELFIEEEK